MIEHRDLKYWESEIKKYSDKVDAALYNFKDRIENAIVDIYTQREGKDDEES